MGRGSNRFAAGLSALAVSALSWSSMKRLAVLASAVTLALPAHGQSAPRVIVDTDMNLDIDDMLALSMLHALESRGEAKIVAITCSLEDRWGPPYIDLIDTFYGRPDIPVGMVRGGFRPIKPPLLNGMPLYTEYFSKLRRPDGKYLFPHQLIDGANAPEAVALLRRTLAQQPDQSVVMIEIGLSTNFARLLDSKPDDLSSLNGSELVKRKVRYLSMMAGSFGDVTIWGRSFPKGGPETNIVLDVEAARRVLSNWPTPIVVSGFEVGGSMTVSGTAIQRDFNYNPRHPIAMTYKYMDEAYKKNLPKGVPWPWYNRLHDHNTWDPSAALYAVRPNDGYFSLSPKGSVTVLSNGGSKFEPRPGGNTQYLEIDHARRLRAEEAMELLVSQPPK